MRPAGSRDQDLLAAQHPRTPWARIVPQRHRAAPHRDPVGGGASHVPREHRGLRPARHQADGDGDLERAILVSLEGLLQALVLEPVGDDHFRAVSEPGRFDRVFGGQTIAQALVAAGATVDRQGPALAPRVLRGGRHARRAARARRRPRARRPVDVHTAGDGRARATATLLTVDRLVPRQPHRSRARRPACPRFRPRRSSRGCSTGCTTLPPDVRRARTDLGRSTAATRPAHRRGTELPRRAPRRRGALALDASARATSVTTRCFTPRCSRTPATTSCSTWRSARTRSATGTPRSDRFQPRPHALVPPPGALRPLAPPHSGDAGPLGRSRVDSGHDPRRRRPSRGQRHAGGAGPPRTLSTRVVPSSASTVTRR